MGKLIGLAGNVAGVTGLLLCLVSGGTRVMGQSYLVGFEAMTLFCRRNRSDGGGLPCQTASPLTSGAIE